MVASLAAMPASITVGALGSRSSVSLARGGQRAYLIFRDVGGHRRTASIIICTWPPITPAARLAAVAVGHVQDVDARPWALKQFAAM